MITDSLTISGIVVSLVVSIIVMIAMIYSHRTTKKEMKALIQRTIMLSGDNEIRELCQKIIAINPNACPLLDMGTDHSVHYDPDKLKALLKNNLQKLLRA